MTMKSALATATSERDQHKRARYALLAMVGQRKREASILHTALADSFTNVTDLVAEYTDLLHFVEGLEDRLSQEERDDLVSLSSNHSQLMRQILSSLPDDSICRDLCLKMLNSDGLAKALDVTPEGYVSPSGDQMLRNVARALGHTMPA